MFNNTSLKDLVMSKSITDALTVETLTINNPDRSICYGSVCSGIEAASVAWSGLGWRPTWFAEIDPFCSELLKQRYPGVPNLGDISSIRNPPNIDLLVGGTPCQSFSVNGLQRGMDDPRGQLTFQFCRIASELRPEWIVWENVPNVLQVDGGRAFGAFAGRLAECGYHLAYRVLDLRFFGIPQRRRRVFVVGHLGDWRRAAGVLFDPPARTKNVSSLGKNEGTRQEHFPTPSLGIRLGFTGDTTPKFGLDCVPTLRSQQGGEGVGVIDARRIRRFSVLEWERLMGFPDDYTRIAIRGKPAGNTARKHALGNSFPVPIVRWIGERIATVNAIAKGRTELLPIEPTVPQRLKDPAAH